MNGDRRPRPGRDDVVVEDVEHARELAAAGEVRLAPLSLAHLTELDVHGHEPVRSLEVVLGR